MTRQGTDVTIVAWSYMAHLAQQAAATLAEEEIEAEVVDVRSLAPLDSATLIASAQKTGRVLVVEEGPLTGGVAAEIATRITEGAFRSLAAPVRRLAMPDVPVPSARELERAVMPDAAAIVEAARDVAMTV